MIHPRTSRNTNLDSIWGSWGAPGISKIDPKSLWMAIFGTLNGEHDSDDDFRCQNCDFGFYFEGAGPLKSTPKCEIMELEKSLRFNLDLSSFGYHFWKVLLLFVLDLFGFVGKRWFREKPCFSVVKSLFFRFGAIWNHFKIDWKIGSKKCGAQIVFWKLLGLFLDLQNHDFFVFV